MNRFRLASVFAVLGMLGTASPAMASDFSGLAYFFIAAIIIGSGTVLLLAFGIRRVTRNLGRKADMVTAIVLALFLAPITFVHSYGMWEFYPVPIFMAGIFVDSVRDLFPWSLLSIGVTAFVIDQLFKLRRERRAEAEGAGEPE